VLLRAIASMKSEAPFGPDIVDFVTCVGGPGSPERKLAVSRFVNVTRAVTAHPGVRARWTSLYRSALALDVAGVKPMFAELDAIRDATIDAALGDPSVLRRRLGPILPVRQEKVLLELKALGEKFPLEFDLNAAGEAEWVASGVERALVEKVLAERDRAPFASIGDFEQRVGRSVASVGLTPVPPDAR
jgi:hypothetical protein